MPLWFVGLAIVVGCLGTAWLLRTLADSLVAYLRPKVRIDEDISEEWRRLQVDAAFRTNGRKLLRGDFNRRF